MMVAIVCSIHALCRNIVISVFFNLEYYDILKYEFGEGVWELVCF